MFDVGFWELILIAIMGLVILGPERLPVAIRTLRGWISGARKFSDTVKSELTEELRIHELHANLKKAEQSNLQDLSPEVAESLKSLQEAAAAVTEPFKKVDRQPLESMIASSLAAAPTVKVDPENVQDTEEPKISNVPTENVDKSVDPEIDKSVNLESDKLQP